VLVVFAFVFLLSGISGRGLSPDESIREIKKLSTPTLRNSSILGASLLPCGLYWRAIADAVVGMGYDFFSGS
jgi:hypothetical protein